ncbi:hypothetical protein SAMN04488527_11054 [Aliiroseovarius crassostreae]|nr:hypothetical protein SAMN04488527_11054 [Aliiroseovarius crassostreae]
MTLEDIKAVVDAGNRVHWVNSGYVVSDGRVSRFAKSISSTIVIKWGA